MGSSVCSYWWGGFGIRSIYLVNASFLCKLTWDILSQDGPRFLLRDRYFHEDGSSKNFHQASSIWSGLRQHARWINEETYWLIGLHSRIKFWTTNWLGYCIADMLDIPSTLCDQLDCTIGDYFIDGIWYFTNGFITRHLDIVMDILRTSIHDRDQRIWPTSCSGDLTSWKVYDFLCPSLLQLSWAPWLWGSFIPRLHSTTVWKVIWEKLPTSDVLQRIGYSGLLFAHSVSQLMKHISTSSRNAGFLVLLWFNFGILIDTFSMSPEYIFT